MNELSFGQWLELSWARYKEKLWEQLVIGGIGSAGGLLAVFFPAAALAAIWAFFGGLSWVAWTVAGLCSVSAVLWLVSWAQAAMMESALTADKLGWRAAYAVSWPKVAPFSWVCILWILALTGGFFMFLIPAVVLSVSLAFAPFVCLSEGATGMAALERSFFFVQDRWWFVLVRLIAIGVAIAAASAVPLVGFILSALAAPFALIASAMLYEDLRRTAPAQDAAARPARPWLLSAAAGLLIFCGLGALSVKSLMSLDTGKVAAALQKMAADHPLDAASGQKLIDSLENGSSQETLSQVMSIIQSTPPAANVQPQRP